MYLVYGTAQAVRSLTASISRIEIDEDASKASFLISIQNPSPMDLGLYSYNVKFYFQDPNDLVDEKTTYNQQPLPLNSNSAMNISMDISLDTQKYYSSNGWTLRAIFRFRTPLPGRTIYHTTVLEK